MKQNVKIKDTDGKDITTEDLEKLPWNTYKKNLIAFE